LIAARRRVHGAIVEVRAAAVDVRYLVVSDVTARTGRVVDEIAFTTPLGSRRIQRA